MSIIVTNAAVVGAGTGSIPFLDRARFGWQSLADTSFQSSGAASLFPAIHAALPDTWQKWKPTASPSYWGYVGGLTSIDYLAVAGHDLADQGITAEWQVSADGNSWTTLLSHTPEDNSPFMFLGVPTTYMGSRVRFINGIPTVARIMTGQSLIMQRPIFAGIEPRTLGRQTEIRSQISDTGSFLGSTTIRRGASLTRTWRHLEKSWVETSLLPFVKQAPGNPFFFAWNPLEAPLDVYYAQLSSDISGQFMGIRDYVQVAIPMIALGDF